MSNTKKVFKDIQKALMTGTSYMMPAVVVGGILFSISLIGGTATDTGYVVTNPFMQNLNLLGKAALNMMIPILGAYVAYSIAGRPGLVPGFILGFVSNNPVGETGAKAGFLGALLLGIVVGYFVKWMKGWKVHHSIRTIMPILIIPILATGVVGIGYIYIIANPLSTVMEWLTNFLANLNGTNKVLLAIAIGFMNAFDMGGPVSKTVTMFTIAMMSQGIYEPNGIYRVCPGIPPMGIFLSTLIFKNKWTDAERTTAKTAGLMGFFGITEGAIPFAVSDLKHVLPATMIGTATGAVIAALGNVKSPVPHGSFITLPVVDGKIWFTVAIIVGTIVTALLLGLFKKNVNEPVQA
ncbi:PTS fructose transporter subunit IIC [Erysipelothrix sp. HDW6C]|uniref:PTS fructose transporter subunit IIC n=1 Tax=Erysipelothrix sp. HDW6C TaxID=2714930 RepID=UPI00140B0BDC|nr:PTS fructose transporter subunit IIC [Erysipelothrix sp. HDW6C]QIK70630.1 PTS fructose transporter subunit IIC [Erysipelothrix sp. HDW6C]